jgi:SAM-dependent methyltransferase
MSLYQSFGSALGSSDSLAKLKALRLPPLKDKSFLDIGCNEGFFCIFAYASGANLVHGIDANGDFIELAKLREERISYFNISWDDWIPDQKYDIILLTSALHYAKDPKALIKKISNALSQNGILIVEMGIVDGSASKWELVKRSIDERYFPTLDGVNDLFDGLAFKVVGRSVYQKGDPIPRWVVHVKKKLPYIFCLFSEGYSGKTTLMKYLSKKTEFRCIGFDEIYYSLILENNVGNQLFDSIKEFDPLTQGHLISNTIFSSIDLSILFINYLSLNTSEVDVILDGFIPEPYRFNFIKCLNEKGFYPVNINLNNDSPHEDLNSIVCLVNDKYLFYNRSCKAHTDLIKIVNLYIHIQGWCIVDDVDPWDKVYVKNSTNDWIEIHEVQNIPRNDLNTLRLTSENVSIKAGFYIKLKAENYLKSSTIELLFHNSKNYCALLTINTNFFI